ncbi:uncharacterized protein KD926_000059 [Aspergillus affinis]|uniref:uncharacterized protein n=1 Tax=Aspergillus affinis TaxID=1070780 RepID=UPI0022FDB144|nr:uncharacterized protein KD926_000059 [Aspergillus affinis]KAI9037718.1 hypothetical protein KD926_000059 [Aspergillus affinis]
MPNILRQFTLSAAENALETAIAVIADQEHEHYSIYEYRDTWKLISNNASHAKVFGQVGFEYGAHVRGEAYKPGKWPLLSLMIPKIQISLHKDRIDVLGYDEEETKAICNSIQKHPNLSAAGNAESSCQSIDLRTNLEKYMSRVGKAISDIRKGLYNNAVLSREISVPFRVDMLATLRRSRLPNTPARTFSFNHMGLQATGFSPEVLLAVQDGNASTEVVAGTCTANEADLCASQKKLLGDPKEVMEHLTVIRGFNGQLGVSCIPGSTRIEDLNDGWDVLAHMLGSVTSPSLLAELRDDIVQGLEPCLRDLYFGAFVMFDLELDFFDSALVLRTVFQDEKRQWLRAGAAVTKNSTPEREFEETYEKLESIASHAITDATL